MKEGDLVRLTVDKMTQMQIISITLDGVQAYCFWRDLKQQDRRAFYPLIALEPWPADEPEEEPIGFFRG